MERKDGKTIFLRKDYDIALLRIDYPAVDEVNGNNITQTVSIDTILTKIKKSDYYT